MIPRRDIISFAGIARPGRRPGLSFSGGCAARLKTRSEDVHIIGVRQSSSFSKLLFDRKQEDTRPIIPKALLNLPVDGVSDPSVVKINLGSSEYELPHVFLRDSCNCSKCVDPSTTQKTFNTGDLDTDVRPAALRVVSNSLEIIWKQDNHRSIYPAQFLANHVSRESVTKMRYNDRVPVTWTGSDMKEANISVDHKNYMESQGTVHKVIQNLADYGLAFINKCPSGPESEGQLEKMTQRIGPLKNTFYGPTWNVRAVESAKNVAYTSVDLDLHMDLLYYESPPGLQFLHCLENQVEGGSSVFVDSFAAAEKMRAEHPEDFQVLCQYQVDFKYENDGVYYHQSRPTIVLNSNTDAIEYVNYSPPFQGTLVPEGFRDYHRAIAIFAKIIAQEEFRHEVVLKAGQCVVFNNRRTLHARRAFGPGKRWLKGSYCDIDALWSKYRVGHVELASG